MNKPIINFTLLGFPMIGFVIIFILFTSCAKNEVDAGPPNIVVIYMDDLGYGDVGVNGSTAIQTPHMDRLANEGIRFTNGYATSATCTPSRYALLTGVYPWREKEARILPGTAPLIIGTEQMTIAKMLKTKGYHTGIVGKWHLGLGTGNVNWNERVSPGPNEVGFDYSYIMAATQDRVPTVYIEDGHVVNLDPSDPIDISYDKNFEGEPTGVDNQDMLKMKWHHGHNNSIVNGIGRIGYMKGGASAKWIDEDMADHFLERAQAYVKQHKDKPFFLYYPLQQPHVPRTPHPRFVGATDLGPRGDVIAEADWCIGEFMKTLEEEGLLENTLIVFTSDNGPVLNDGYYDDSDTKNGDHKPWGPFRGGKYSLFEAGTHVPFFTYWKGKINPGVSDKIVSQLDLLSSIASIVGSEIRTSDSQDLKEVLMGQEGKGRENLVIEATTRTAYRKGDWVMIPPYDRPPVLTNVNIELGNAPEYQLYNLKADIGERNNVATSNTEILEQMKLEFARIKGDVVAKIESIELK